MSLFIEYQRKMWVVMTYCGLCPFYLDYDRNGHFVIRSAGKLRLFFYYFLWVNSVIKLIYLILTYHGLTGVEVHFLDQMSMWDWFLCMTQLVQEGNMWYWKYPLYEVIHNNWKLQLDIFRKLGQPEHINKQIHKSDRILVYLHSVIVIGGCFLLLVQFYMGPKYALNTYAAVPYDNFFLSIVFAAHEYFFMWHIWVHHATSVVLIQVYAVSYTHIVREMTAVMYGLIECGRERPVSTPEQRRRHRNSMSNSRRPLSQSSFSSDVSVSSVRLSTPKPLDDHWTIKNKFLDPATVLPGTNYNISTLITDYQRLMLATNAYNSWVGKLMGGIIASDYTQFVSDVFMTIQLLKEPGTTFMDVVFFCEDASAGMIELFRMFILISRLTPASEEFLHAFHLYLQYDVPSKKYYLKLRRTFKRVAAKLGGYSTRGITVPKSIHTLMSWYIAAAMWKRPEGRKT